ncbi:acyltransferase [Bosea sp. 124]|uniref:acyltransferase family protein n=1 Tax=Bosea sp. 124 TaxID=2135642 RepID=UPI000D4262CB|nr:acyltransferase [Bosea sp. 124]PTM41743.1 peptidoglycan/LPS O-acetylase OafA/YrhL [Bosea sp. 124]
MTPSASRLQLVELLRGLAAVSVAWFHLTATHKNSWVAASGTYGWLGVEVFFVISGFIVPYSMKKLFSRYRFRDAPIFLMRRIIRLEPAYIVSLLLVLALYHASRLAPSFQGIDQYYSPQQLLFHFFYLIPFTQHQWLQPVYWTLAYEFAFYLFMALTLSAFCGRHHRSAAIACVGILAAGILAGVLPARLMLFVMGFAVFRKETGFCGKGEALLLIAVAGFAMIMSGSTIEAICGSVTALLLAAGTGISFPPRAAAVITALGTISYSLYLVHIPIGGRVVNLGHRFVQTSSQEFALSILAMAISLCAAWVLWRLVERPSINASRKWAPRHLPSPLAVS